MLNISLVERNTEGREALAVVRQFFEVQDVADWIQIRNIRTGERTYIYKIDQLISVANRIVRELTDTSKDAPQQHREPRAQSPVNALDQALGTIADLQERVRRLQEAGKIVIAQRDNWKARAMDAEASSLGDGASHRYVALKRFLARNFHPDNAPGSGIEKLLRAEIFKEIWSGIDHIESGIDY